jgi:putative nucleotidyltransferase with HDIG domain
MDLTNQSLNNRAESSKLNILLEATQHLSSILNLDELLTKIVDSSVEVCGAERGFLILHNKERGELQMAMARGIETEVESAQPVDYKKYKLSRAIVSSVQSTNESLLFDLSSASQLSVEEDIKIYGVKSVICVPLKTRNEFLGLIYLDNRISGEAFSRKELDMINSLAIQAGISMQNAFLVGEMVEKDARLKQKAAQLTETLNIVQKRSEQLSSVSEICRVIALSLDVSTILQGLVTQIARILGVERISVMLLDKNKQLTIRASLGIPIEIIKGTSIKLGEKISGWVAENQQPLLIEDIEQDSRFVPRTQETYYTKSLICCPMVVSDKTIGVININNKKDHKQFNIYELEIIKALCADIAVAIENASLYTELRQAYINTVESLALAVDAKDHYTQGHLKRVSEIALDLGRELDLSPSDMEDLRNAALLHDIGKIGISDTILLKPGRLTEEEWAIIKSHSMVSEKIIRPLGPPEAVYEIVRHHHEHYNGTGYPDQKKGDEISLKTSILSVADAYDAMTTDRPYRKALSKEEVISEFQRCKGTQFNPQVVDAFLKFLMK